MTAQPTPPSARQNRLADRVRARGRALLDALILLGELLYVAVLILGIATAIGLSWLWVGLLVLPALYRALHRQLVRVSARCEPYLGRPLRLPELPARPEEPADPADGVLEKLRRTEGIRLLASEEAWQLLWWGLVESLVGIILATMPLLLIGEGLRGLLVAPLLTVIMGWQPDEWYLWVRVADGMSLVAAMTLGLLLVIVGWLTATFWLRQHARLSSAAIGSRRTELRARVDQLTRSRAGSRRDAAAELKRIEREVHDGTQAQLATIGLRLGTADALWDSDPDRARAIVEEARGDASAALDELRALMRGIRPPVLADRGLAAALEDLAIASGSAGPGSTSVTAYAALSGNYAPDIESAVYFAARELVTNALKHARAERITVTATESPERLQLVVLDDGAGGARETPGHGLAGLAERLAAFDGTLTVSSPAGGPTRITVEVPCGS